MRIKQYLKTLPVALLILLALFVSALFLFGFIVHQVLWEQKIEADDNILVLLSQHLINPRLTSFMKAVTHCASGGFLQVAYGLLICIYLIRRRWKRAAEIAFIGIGGFIVNYFMKSSFQRLRPPDPLIDGLNNFSFPSGHATSGFIFYGLLAYIVWTSNIPRPFKYIAGTTLVLFSLLIGFSRIYLRVHYPSDVIAGFCVGFSWLLLTCLLFEYLQKRKTIKAKGNAGEND